MKTQNRLGKIILSLILGLIWIISLPITFKYSCDYPEYGPTFYGLPFVQQTNTTWVNSFSGEIYISGFLGNLFLWSLFFFGILNLISYRLRDSLKKLSFYFGLLSFSICIFFVSLHFSVYEWRATWSHNDFKLNYYNKDIQCERDLLFFH